MALKACASSPSSSRVVAATTWSSSPRVSARAPRVTSRTGPRIDWLKSSAMIVATAAAPASAPYIRRTDTAAASRARRFSSSMFFWFRLSTSSAFALIALNSGRSCAK